MTRGKPFLTRSPGPLDPRGRQPALALERDQMHQAGQCANPRRLGHVGQAGQRIQQVEEQQAQPVLEALHARVHLSVHAAIGAGQWSVPRARCGTARPSQGPQACEPPPVHLQRPVASDVWPVLLGILVAGGARREGVPDCRPPHLAPAVCTELVGMRTSTHWSMHSSGEQRRSAAAAVAIWLLTPATTPGCCGRPT